MPANEWKTTEVKYLKESYGKIKAEEIATHLNRSTNSVLKKASKLNLRSDLPSKGAHDVDFIREMLSQNKTVTEIAKALGVSRNAVSKRIRNNPKRYDKVDKYLARTNYFRRLRK